MSIVILNKKDKKNNPKCDVIIYCGRGSILGNEHNFKYKNQFQSFNVESREHAIELNKKTLIDYLMDERNFMAKSQKVKDEMNKIFKLNKTKKIGLECYCKNYSEEDNINIGESCHAEDIKYIIEKISENKDLKTKDILKIIKKEWNIL